MAHQMATVTTPAASARQTDSAINPTEIDGRAATIRTISRANTGRIQSSSVVLGCFQPGATTSNYPDRPDLVGARRPAYLFADCRGR